MPAACSAPAVQEVEAVPPSPTVQARSFHARPQECACTHTHMHTHTLRSGGGRHIQTYVLSLGMGHTHAHTVSRGAAPACPPCGGRCRLPPGCLVVLSSSLRSSHGASLQVYLGQQWGSPRPAGDHGVLCSNTGWGLPGLKRTWCLLGPG